jgi:hypothetical protein
MRTLSIIAGLSSAACGTFLIWMLYGFASMMDPDMQGAARESAIWVKVSADGHFPVGIVVIAASIWLICRKPKRAA